MENSQSLNLISSGVQQDMATVIKHPVPKNNETPSREKEFCSLQWILSQSILKSRPFAVVTDELLHAGPIDVRKAAESIAEPAGYLVVPVSSRAALMENVVNQVLARIAVENNGSHEKPVSRKDAQSRLQQLIATPDQRIALIIQNGEQIPAETFRGLAKALRAVAKTGSESEKSLPSLVVVIGTEQGFFNSLKGQLVLSILGENGVVADDGAGLIKLLEDHSSTQTTDSDTAWQLTRERLGRHASTNDSSAPVVKPENSLVVVDPINSPRARISAYGHLRSLAGIGSSIGASFSNLFSGRKRRARMERWMNQPAQTNSRKTPTFQPQPPAQLK